LSARQSGVTLLDPCYVIFTSGSTGRPKGVVVVRAAAVTVRMDGAIQELAAFVVPTEREKGVDHRALSQALRQRLPEYMIPKYLDAIQELPRLTSGKLDRHQLPPSTTLLASSERESVCAQTAPERDMVEVFQTCLGVSPIFVTDDVFTDLGGHSLLAARVVTALRSKFNTSRIGVRDIYEHRTIRQPEPSSTMRRPLRPSRPYRPGAATSQALAAGSVLPCRRSRSSHTMPS
jgi:hypothetical protein